MTPFPDAHAPLRVIELFERKFIEPQEALGMRIVGTFRDLDDPDRFVWMRGFESMAARAAALSAFYGGPVWKAHRDAANPTTSETRLHVISRQARRVLEVLTSLQDR